MSRNGQLFVFQCDTELTDLIDADLHRSHGPAHESSSSEDDDDIEPGRSKRRRGHCSVFVMNVT